MRTRLGDVLLDHLGALDVDLEDHVVAGDQRVADLGARRPVPVAVDLVRLEQLAGLAERVEPVDVEEVVAHAVDLARPAARGSCRSRRSGSRGSPSRRAERRR